mgnify:CR=1 FL=1
MFEISFTNNGFQILTLNLGKRKFTAWDTYRPSPEMPAFLTLLATIYTELPELLLSSAEEENWELIEEEPWKMRTNLSGLVLKCGAMTVRWI